MTERRGHFLMCGYKQACARLDEYWVMTQRGEVGTRDVAARSITTCSVHLRAAIKSVREVNIQLGGNVSRPDTDGVIVKMKTVHQETGIEYWE
jgi:hypothetical protein